MKFRRWGTLVPQKHVSKHDFFEFHDAPVVWGIYAFPYGYGNYDSVYGYGCIANGRREYVKDKDGKRIMMTKKQFEAIIRKDRGPIEWGHSVVISPDFLRGMNYDSLFLQTEKIYYPRSYYNNDEDVVNSEEDTCEYGARNDEEDDKAYPLMKCHGETKVFNYNGNVWHHLEITNSYEFWKNSPDGIESHVNFCGTEMGIPKEELEIVRKEAIEEASKCRTKYKRLIRSEDIICRNGTWILTDMRTYEQALKKAVHIFKFDKMAYWKRNYEDFPDHYKSTIIRDGRPLGLPNHEFDWSEFEVFIERVK